MKIVDTFVLCICKKVLIIFLVLRGCVSNPNRNFSLQKSSARPLPAQAHAHDAVFGCRSTGNFTREIPPPVSVSTDVCLCACSHGRGSIGGNGVSGSSGAGVGGVSGSSSNNAARSFGLIISGAMRGPASACPQYPFRKKSWKYRTGGSLVANTLLQTAIMKPSIKTGKVNNLYFAGQLTSPGPGVPPSIISGQVRAIALLCDDRSAACSSFSSSRFLSLAPSTGAEQRRFVSSLAAAARQLPAAASFLCARRGILRDDKSHTRADAMCTTGGR